MDAMDDKENRPVTEIKSNIPSIPTPEPYVKNNKNIDAENLTAKDYYADSYAHFGIHEEMLKDEVRTLTYRNSMINNKHLFKDKIVLDVGCGTGILSMFAAEAGAKHVFSVDMSNIIESARGIVKDNGYEDKITLIKGKIEEIEIPGIGFEGVDIIISEWMGYGLVYESMLESVLYARDKWLNKKTGIMMPDKCSMYLTAIEDHHYMNEKMNFWDDVYGFDMTRIKKIAISEGLVDTVDPRQICTKHCKLIDFDLYTITKEDAGKFKVDYQLKVTRKDYIHAVVLYWTCEFTKCHRFTGFSTSPTERYTHWKQTVFYLNQTLTVNPGEELKGSLYCYQNPDNRRDLEFEIEYNFDGELSQMEGKKKYKLR